MVEAHFCDGKKRSMEGLKKFLQTHGPHGTYPCALVYILFLPVCFPAIPHSIVTAAGAPPVTATPCHR